jgi:hypothetical protein
MDRQKHHLPLSHQSDHAENTAAMFYCCKSGSCSECLAMAVVTQQRLATWKVYLFKNCPLSVLNTSPSYSTPSCSTTTSLPNGKLHKSSSSLSQGNLPKLYPPTDQSVSFPLYPNSLKSLWLLLKINQSPWILQAFDWTPWTGDQPVVRHYLHDTTQTQNKRRHECLKLGSNPRSGAGTGESMSETCSWDGVGLKTEEIPDNTGRNL